MKINVGKFLAQRAMLSPNQIGLVHKGREFSFRQLNRRANRLAHALTALGVRHGDRVGLLGLNSVVYFDLFFGLAKLGAVLVPVNHRLALPELSSILQDSGARVLLFDPEFSGIIDSIRKLAPPFLAISTDHAEVSGPDYDELLASAQDTEPLATAGDDDELAVLYTVWATGRPKGVTLTHANFFWTSVTTMATLPRLGPAFLLALPLFHIGGLAWLPVLMHLGAKCVLLSSFEPELFLRLLQQQQATSFGVVPTMLYFLKNSPDFPRTDFSRLRSILAYGSALPPNLIDEYAQAGIAIQQLYGLTECTGPAMVVDAEHSLSKAGSCGLPFFYTDVKLVDEKGTEVPRGQTGEVIIASPNVMKGYWNQPEATADAIRGGWLFTGDLGQQDHDGYYYIVDRKKEIIISGGENIFPGEIERVIFEHPGVEDVAVLGLPDEIWGETVVAVLVKKKHAQLSSQDIVNFCKDKIADYKIPRHIIFVSSIPRTKTGKMQKRKLRDLLQNQQTT